MLNPLSHFRVKVLGVH